MYDKRDYRASFRNNQYIAFEPRVWSLRRGFLVRVGEMLGLSMGNDIDVILFHTEIFDSSRVDAPISPQKAHRHL
jgi:hypothetical protein